MASLHTATNGRMSGLHLQSSGGLTEVPALCQDKMAEQVRVLEGFDWKSACADGVPFLIQYKEDRSNGLDTRCAVQEEALEFEEYQLFVLGS